MAKLLWGTVYFHDYFAGILRQESSDRISFTYDQDYVAADHPAIAHTLPIRGEPYISHTGLHPFFDNLVAEGWLEQAQTRLLGKREISRFEILLAFGADCIGAVSIIDPEPAKRTKQLLDLKDRKELAVLTSHASLSGVQPKLAVIERDGKYYAATANEISSHIAKFTSMDHSDLLYNEYLTTLACKALLPDHPVAQMSIGEISGQDEEALIIKRFDRTAAGRVHFEEFNQLLGYKSDCKYNGSYQEMAVFINTTTNCLPVESYALFERILGGILLGNTDMHLKNFAMFHTASGLRLVPVYDEVGAALYQYKTMALKIAGKINCRIGALKANHIIALGKEFALTSDAINMAVMQLAKTKDAAKQVILEAKVGSVELKNNLIAIMDKRWNGTFALIGKKLLTRR